MNTILTPSRLENQLEDLKDCSGLKPLSVARFQLFANNSLYYTARSRTLGENYTNLLNESKLIKDKSSTRHNRYKDDLNQTRQNELNKYLAMSLWLEDIERNPGWHECPIPKFFSTYKRETYLIHIDGRVSVWALIKSELQQVANTTIEKLKNRCNAHLDIIREVQQASVKPKKFGDPYKSTTFGKTARRTLLEAGQIVDTACGTNSCVVTLTLPGDTHQAKDALANYSSYILNRLLQVPRRVDAPIYLFSVWELQKRGALHLHICVAANPGDVSITELEAICHLIKDKWYQLLLEMITTKPIKRGNRSGNYPGVDMFERYATKSKHTTWRYSPQVWRKGWDIQPIKKSVAKYFAKYASKETKSSNGFNLVNSLNPSRWWSCNKPIRDKIKAIRYDYTVGYNELDTNEMIDSILEVYPPLMSYEYDFHIKAKSYKITRQGDDEFLDINSESTVTIVNGKTKIYFWTPEDFIEVNQVIRDLKTTFSEIGHHREKNDRYDLGVYTC